MIAELTTIVMGLIFAGTYFFKQKNTKAYSKKMKEKIKLSGIIAIWDTTTLDHPDPSIIRREMCRELYFTSGDNDRPNITAVKNSTGITEVIEFNFKTSIQTSIQLNLLFSITPIVQKHKNNCELHIFTKCPQLKKRFTLQANAHNINKIFFYGVD